MMYREISILALLAVTLVPNALANEIQQVERLVVSGTRTPKLLNNSPVAVDVVSGELLQQVSRGTLAQALNFLPGVVVKRSVKDGYNVMMQGFDSDHVLILLDGQPLISPSGSSVDLDQISADEIEQIEIVKGAGSVLYGSSAMGGVINIISRQDKGNSLSSEYQVSRYLGNEVDGDTLGHLYKLRGSAKVAQWQAKLSLQKIDDPGFDYEPASIAQTSASLDKHFARFELARNLDGLRLGYKLQYFEEEKLKDRFKVPGQDSVVYYLSDVEQWQQDVLVSQQHDWQLKGRYIKHNETSGDSNGLRETDISLAELDAQKVWMLDGMEVVGGVIWHTDTLDQSKLTDGLVEVADKDRQSLEAYSQINWMLDKVDWLAGLRVQHDTDFGWHSALRASGMYKYIDTAQNTWQWRAGLGQSYRVPTLKERFYVFDHSNLGYMVLGNENLNPETALSANAGLTLTVPVMDDSHDLQFEIAGHYTRTDDFINTIRDAAASAELGLDVSRYANVAESTIAGLDLSAELTLDNWRYQLSYAYLHTENEQGEPLTGRPKHQLKFNLGWSYPAWQLDSLFYAVYEAGEQAGQDYQGILKDDWLSLNLSLSQHLSQSLSWRLAVDNLLDEHRDASADAAGLFDVRPISSRRLTLGVNYQFL
ncbi:TonB-dependent receptor [Bowmanella denitrificans]